MKPDFKTWFAGLPAVPGMLACGVRRPDGRCAGHGGEKNYPVEKIEKFLGQFENRFRYFFFANSYHQVKPICHSFFEIEIFINIETPPIENERFSFTRFSDSL